MFWSCLLPLSAVPVFLELWWQQAPTMLNPLCALINAPLGTGMFFALWHREVSTLKCKFEHAATSMILCATAMVARAFGRSMCNILSVRIVCIVSCVVGKRSCLCSSCTAFWAGTSVLAFHVLCADVLQKRSGVVFVVCCPVQMHFKTPLQPPRPETRLRKGFVKCISRRYG